MRGATWIMRGAARHVRKAITPGLRVARHSAGNFQRVFGGEETLGETTAERHTTTGLVRIVTVGLTYAVWLDPARLRFGGANAQHGQGRWSTVRRDGKVFLRGTQASHFAIGGWTLDGKPVTQHVLSVLQQLREHSDDPAYRKLRDMVAFLLRLEGSTVLTPAFINQANFKAYEEALHHYMKGFQPFVMSGAGGLERGLDNEGFRAIDTYGKDIVFVDPIRERNRYIAATGKQYLQDPLDTVNSCFKCSEYVLNEATVDVVRQVGGPYQKRITQFRHDLPETTRYLAGSAGEIRDFVGRFRKGLPR